MRLTPCFVALCVCFAALAASARPNTNAQSEKLLRDSLAHLRAGRRLSQSSAVSRARGSQSASAKAVAGPGTASTEQSATGPGSQVAGVSQVGEKIQACAQGPASSAACQTLTTEDRSAACTDIPPAAIAGATQYTCPEQAGFQKCDESFIYLGAFCLQSCGRCGAGCVDTAPYSGFSCSVGTCNSTEVIAGPYCLKTCSRCTSAATSGGAGVQGTGVPTSGTGMGPTTASASATAVSGR